LTKANVMVVAFVQVHVTKDAPYLQGAPIVLAADCMGFAIPGFRQAFLKGGKSALFIGCPKLDDADFYDKSNKKEGY